MSGVCDKRHDLLVVGAGIFGLWAARHALKRGERVIVLEKRTVGAGASGGFLGSLMPHMPDRWNAKKQMQYDGLRSIGDAIADLEADTGIDCGYRRCGRLMPLAHEKMLDHARERIEGSHRHWVDAAGEAAFFMRLIEPPFSGTIADGWLSEEVAPFGATYDTLSARVNPRAYLAALAEYVRNHPSGELREGAGVAQVRQEGDDVFAELENGDRVHAGRGLIANGFEAYSLLSELGGSAEGQPLTGRGVKGQAVLLEHAHGDDRPIIYDSGSYIVPHGRCMGENAAGQANRVAVGSTSRNDWIGQSDASLAEAERSRFDPGDMDFLAHARALSPAIRDAAVAERWANVRPRNTIPDKVTGKIGTEPVFGPLDDQPLIGVAIGGFKISLGIAHIEGGCFATCDSPDIS